MELDFSTLLATLLTVAFTAWAGVVAWFARGIRSDLKDIARFSRQEAEKLNLYIVQTETRLAVLEERIDNHKRR